MDKEAMRKAFEEWVLEEHYAYRDQNGIWFYPEYGNGNLLWQGWQAAMDHSEDLRMKELADAVLSRHGG